MAFTEQDFADRFGLPDSKGLALDVAAGYFAAAAEGVDPLQNVALAFRAFLLAVARGEHRAFPRDAGRLAELNLAAAMTLLRRVNVVPLESAIVGFGNFRRLVELLFLPEMPPAEIDETLVDRLDQVALFADELDALRRRGGINARGAPLARFQAIQAALIAEPVGDQPH